MNRITKFIAILTVYSLCVSSKLEAQDWISRLQYRIDTFMTNKSGTKSISHISEGEFLKDELDTINYYLSSNSNNSLYPYIVITDTTTSTPTNTQIVIDTTDNVCKVINTLSSPNISGSKQGGFYSLAIDVDNKVLYNNNNSPVRWKNSDTGTIATLGHEFYYPGLTSDTVGVIYSVTEDSRYVINMSLNVQSVTTDVLFILVTFNDLHGSSINKQMYKYGTTSTTISTTGFQSMQPMYITVKAGFDIQIATIFSTSGGSINYDFDANITKL